MRGAIARAFPVGRPSSTRPSSVVADSSARVAFSARALAAQLRVRRRSGESDAFVGALPSVNSRVIYLC